jgi:DNA-binding beta-propeller fold protein YncE
LAVDPQAQKLYVAQGSDNVKVFNTANLSQPPSTISDVTQPGGVAIDHTAGRVYITENDAGDVRAYDESTNQYLSTPATGLLQPFGDADDSTAGKLYVVEFGNDDVKVFNTQNPSQAPQTIGGVTDPWAVAVGP